MILRSVKEFLREYCIKVVDCYVFSLFRLCLCWEFWFCYYFFFNYFLIIFIVIRYIFEDILLIIVYLIVNLIILFVIVELLINSGVYKC